MSMRSKIGKTDSERNTKVLKNVRAKIVESRKAANTGSTKSTAVNNDPMDTLSESGKVIEPPFDLLSLVLLQEHSTELQQCVEVMEVNIDSFGHRFVSRLKNQPGLKIHPKTLKEVKMEKVYLENFFNNCTKESFVKFRRKLRKDLEMTGICFFEVVRGLSGKIQSFVHLPSYQMRLGRTEKDFTENKRPVYQLQIDGSVKIVELNEFTRFRTFAQSRGTRRRNLEMMSDQRVRWFKEFGDTRVYDNRTGEINDQTPLEHRANEVVYMDLYSARSPYGMPRYIGNLLSIFGDRAAEEINYLTFKNNNIPSMVICVSNGRMSPNSMGAIETFVETQIQGSDNYSKFLVLEAEGDDESDDGSQVKLDVKPLVSEQHKDALFQNYSKNNKDNIRRVWRIPPIFLGQAEDYNKATADTSRRLGDEQVFAPERNEFDEMMNRLIFPNLGVVYHSYTSNSPNTTDNEQLVKMLSSSEKTGGMTPFIARWILEEILGRDLPEFPADFDPHKPFSLLMAKAVQNRADPTEPGQQVTAIKEDGTINETVLVNKLVSALKPGDPIVDHLLEIQKETEKMWADDLGEDHEHLHEEDE